ncbi:hypothetical protein WJX72_003879 [[Myrmecia] bisecta]|uniref:Uncharacterized protein n=1 Tax=[Myrmecia] bisecta TaxID=41462 RepID=A0AAW1P5J1_9CHLO
MRYSERQRLDNVCSQLGQYKNRCYTVGESFVPRQDPGGRVQVGSQLPGQAEASACSSLAMQLAYLNAKGTPINFQQLAKDIFGLHDANEEEPSDQQQEQQQQQKQQPSDQQQCIADARQRLRDSVEFIENVRQGSCSSCSLMRMRASQLRTTPVQLQILRVLLGSLQ